MRSLWRTFSLDTFGKGGGMYTVLVVDDDASIQRSTERAIRSRGHAALQATTLVEEAVALFNANFDAIHGILVDGMEGRGPEFVKYAREKGFSGPIIACSANDDESLNNAMISGGANTSTPPGIGKSEAVQLFFDLVQP